MIEPYAPNALKDIRQEKFSLIDGYGFFTDPNNALSVLLNCQVDIFDENQNEILLSFTNHGNELLEDRIRLIIENDAPSYITEKYEQNHYPNFQAGDFWARNYYSSKRMLFENSVRYGEILLVFDKSKHYNPYSDLMKYQKNKEKKTG